MNWYETKVGKTQIVGFIVLTIIIFYGEHSKGEIYSVIETLFYSMGGPMFFIFFFPSVLIPIFTKSEDTKLTSVFVMIMLCCMGIYQNYMVTNI